MNKRKIPIYAHHIYFFIKRGIVAIARVYTRLEAPFFKDLGFVIDSVRLRQLRIETDSLSISRIFLE